jgi:beta-mannosidase
MVCRISSAVCFVFVALNIAWGVALGQQTDKTLWQPYYISPRVGDQHISLSGKWGLSHRDAPISNLEDLRDQPQWIAAEVPSSVQWALFQAGELPHPYYHLNSQKYSWVPDNVWYYRRQFQVPASVQGHYVFICFDGSGYYSKIWLNGELLGRHEGMFGGPDVEVSKHLRFGSPNELVVEVKAASYGVADWGEKSLQNVILPWGIGGGDPYVTGYSGIGTKEFLPFGIWRDVRLEIVPPAHLERPFLVTEEANSRVARLALTTEVMINAQSLEFQLHPWQGDQLGGFRNATTSRFTSKHLALQVQFFGKGATKPILIRSFPLKVYEGRNWVKQEIQIPSPKLWWPNGMGDPNLYRVKLALLSEDQPVDRMEFDFGIRTIQQVPSAGPRTQDNWANWQFVVNGRRLFVKGANWAWPMDVLLNLPRDHYSWQLEAARAGGIQMLRVWGGGNPETEDFFALCDQLGIMVWEDFPVANTDTPGWKPDVWEAQAAHIILGLRNHPSLAVWCGGNEFNAYSLGNTATTGVLERLVALFDGTRFFLRTTPDPGDIHAYPDMDPTWFGPDYSLVPFVSETGIFDMCEPESIREVVDPQEFDKPLHGVFSKEFAASHPDFVHHFLQYKLSGPQQTMWGRASQMDDLTDPTLEGLIEAARAGVGEFVQVSADLLQANYPVTTGMMPWSFTIPWPIVFPAWLDAFGQSTDIYYFLQRSYEPTHVVVRLPQLVWAPGEKVPIQLSVVHAPATLMEGLVASVEVSDDRFHSLWRQQRTLGIKAGPSVSNLNLGEFPIPQNLEDKFFFVVAELKRADGQGVSRSVYWPRALKLMADPEFRARYRATSQPSLVFEHGPWLRKQVEATSTSLALRVVSQTDDGENRSRVVVLVRNTGALPAFFTDINIEGTKRAFYGTDNFFWLPAGEERRLEFHVLWRNPVTVDGAYMTAKAWNAPSNRATLPPR